MTSPIMNSRILGANFLPANWVPTKDDVIIGRGKKVHGHAGNQKLRELVQEEVTAYANAKNRAAKSTIIIRVFKAVRTDSPIGFVKRDPKTKKYYAVEDTAAKITIAQYFRDALADGYKSSKQYKQKLRDALKRSVSDVGQDCKPMAHCSMTAMKRSVSLGDSSMLPFAINRSVFDDEVGEPSEESPSHYMKMARLQARAKSNSNKGTVHNILQSASDLLADDDDCAFPDTMVEETNVRISSDDNIISKQAFANLYAAFGSDIDSTSDPFEPTPLKEEGSTKSSLKTETSTTNASPFSFSFEDAFGHSKDSEDSNMAAV